MSNWFEMLVDGEAEIEEAEVLSCAVLDRFRRLGLITGSANPDCVFGGTGYRPGPALAESYTPKEHEFSFWELVKCGVEPQVRRGLNEWALGPVCEGFICPSCGVDMEPSGSTFWNSVWKAIGEWKRQSGSALLRCLQCGRDRSITEWQCRPPLGFGNLSFRFWNWPRFDSPGWKIDITAIIRETTHHTIVTTYGRI